MLQDFRFAFRLSLDRFLGPPFEHTPSFIFLHRTRPLVISYLSYELSDPTYEIVLIAKMFQ